MKRYSFLFLFLSIVGFTQSDESMRVYFNDGRVIIGELIEKDGGNYTMLTEAGDTLAFHRIDAVRIVRGEIHFMYPNGKFHYKERTFYAFSFGTNGGTEEEDDDRLLSTHMEFLYGKRITPKLSLAAGLGFEFNQLLAGGFRFDTQFLSPIISGRYYLNNHQARLFIYGRLGYGWAPQEPEEIAELSGGTQYSYGAGLHLASRKKGRFYFTVEQYNQKTAGSEFFLDSFGNELMAEYDLWIRRVLFKIAYEIH